MEGSKADLGTIMRGLGSSIPMESICFFGYFGDKGELYYFLGIRKKGNLEEFVLKIYIK